MVLAFGIWCYDTLAPWWSSEKTGREGYWRSTVVRGIREKWGIPQKTLTQSSAGTRESSWTQLASKHNRFSFWDGTDSTKLHIPVSQRDLHLSFWGVVWCGVVAAGLAAAAWRHTQVLFVQLNQAFPYLLVIHIHIYHALRFMMK